MNPDFRECVRKLYQAQEKLGLAGLTIEEDEWVRTYLDGGDFGPTLDSQLKTLELAVQTVAAIPNDRERTSASIDIFQKLKVIRNKSKDTPDEAFNNRLARVAVMLKKEGFQA